MGWRRLTKFRLRNKIFKIFVTNILLLLPKSIFSEYSKSGQLGRKIKRYFLFFFDCDDCYFINFVFFLIILLVYLVNSGALRLNMYVLIW